MLIKGRHTLQVSRLAKFKDQEGNKSVMREKRLKCVKSINDGLMCQVAEQHAQYLELAQRCKTLDRCFSKAFQGLGAQFEAAMDVYR